MISNYEEEQQHEDFLGCCCSFEETKYSQKNHGKIMEQKTGTIFGKRYSAEKDNFAFIRANGYGSCIQPLIAPKKEELSEPSHTLTGWGLKGRVGNGLLLVSSRIRSTFVGYPLHSYLLVTRWRDIR